MTPSRGIFATFLFSLVRFSPVLLGYLFLDISGLAEADRATRVDRTLRLAALLVAWSLTEGLCMLWIKKKSCGSPDSRGFGAVAIIGGALVLGFLEVFRLQVAQHHFLLLLGALALRGMSRSGWDQGRAHISIVTSILAHSLLTALSFLLILDFFPWPTFVLSLAVGAMVGSIEASWHGSSFKGCAHTWVVPLHRIATTFGPLAVATLALSRALPSCYAATILLFPVASRVARSASIGRLVAGKDLYSISGMYVMFVVIILLCRLYG